MPFDCFGYRLAMTQNNIECAESNALNIRLKSHLRLRSLSQQIQNLDCQHKKHALAHSGDVRAVGITLQHALWSAT